MLQRRMGHMYAPVLICPFDHRPHWQVNWNLKNIDAHLGTELPDSPWECWLDEEVELEDMELVEFIEV